MEKSKEGYALYSKDECIQLVKSWYKEHGKIRIRDLRHSNGLPSTSQVIHIFGSFKQCLIESGIVLDNASNFDRESLSDFELLKKYRVFTEEYLKLNLFLPTLESIDIEETLPHSSTYINRFGSISNLNKLIGFNQNEHNNKALEDDMLFKYKRACKYYNKVLSSREITALSKNKKDYIYSTMAYLNHFGSLKNLQDVCGFICTRPGNNITRDDMINCLRKLGAIIGRKPIQKDLILFDFMPSCSSYCREFGSFKNALKEAGYEKIRILKTKNGVKVNSTYELKFAQVLELHDINYETEVMYNSVIPNFERKYRFDFVILLNNSKYFIEIFGIEGNDNYDKRKLEKIELCQKYKIPLIQVYQEDIYAKTNAEIYGMITKHILEIV